jgi:hypothetical protein
MSCHLCGEWKGHSDECAMPYLEDWLARQNGLTSPGDLVLT